MTRHCEVIPMGKSVQAADQPAVTNNAALFISTELLPMMISLWPKSANQINSNLPGNGIAYGMMLKGVLPRQIRDAVVALAEREPAREYAPEPQLLKRLCLTATTDQACKATKPEASIRAIELQAQVAALNGEISDSEISTYTAHLADRYRARGFEITGRIS